MTTTPEADLPTPASPPPTTDATASDDPAPSPARVGETSALAERLDRGAFDRVLTPRGAAIELAGVRWHGISRRYPRVEFILTGLVLLVVLAAGLIPLAFGVIWQLIPAAAITVGLVWSLALVSRRARATAYALREDDLVFRRGILWQRIVAVPYGRMQLVDITHGPLDRTFDIAQLKLVTAAASTAVTIPGLSQDAALALRDHLIAVAEDRRTGL